MEYDGTTVTPFHLPCCRLESPLALYCTLYAGAHSLISLQASFFSVSAGAISCGPSIHPSCLLPTPCLLSPARWTWPRRKTRSLAPPPPPPRTPPPPPPPSFSAQPLPHRTRRSSSSASHLPQSSPPPLRLPLKGRLVKAQLQPMPACRLSFFPPRTWRCQMCNGR